MRARIALSRPFVSDLGNHHNLLVFDSLHLSFVIGYQYLTQQHTPHWRRHPISSSHASGQDDHWNDGIGWWRQCGACCCVRYWYPTTNEKCNTMHSFDLLLQGVKRSTACTWDEMSRKFVTAAQPIVHGPRSQLCGYHLFSSSFHFWHMLTVIVPYFVVLNCTMLNYVLFYGTVICCIVLSWIALFCTILRWCDARYDLMYCTVLYRSLV